MGTLHIIRSIRLALPSIFASITRSSNVEPVTILDRKSRRERGSRYESVVRTDAVGDPKRGINVTSRGQRKSLISYINTLTASIEKGILTCPCRASGES